MTDSEANDILEPEVRQQMDAALLSLHWTFLVMALVVVGLSIVMQAEGPATVFFPGTKWPLPELCSAKRVMGVPCPGCGLTRSFISIGHGQFSRAWSFNPSSFLLYPFVALQIPWRAFQIWSIRRRGYAVEFPGSYWLPIVVAVVMLGHWFYRLSYWQF